MRVVACILVLSTVAIAAASVAQGPALGRYERLAREIFRELVEIRSTESGAGSTPAAEAMARRLLAAGYPAGDVQVAGPSLRKQNVVARLHGRTGARPVLLFAHLDVVEARKEDWSAELDPFRFTELDGYFYGRGAQDMKDCVAILVANFVRWKQEGWIPERDVILALTADEEAGDENGVQWLARTRRDLIDAEYAINADIGDFRSKNGRPYVASIAAAEKTYTELELIATNPGGHASLPRSDNAVLDLAMALERIARFQFPAMPSELTRAQFAAMARLEQGQTAADMDAVAESRADAIARLSHDPYNNALLRTTCVATMLEGGHAPNALPQSARAVLNCRLLPGHPKEDVLRAITEAVGTSRVKVRWQFEIPAAPASRLRPDVMSGLEMVAHEMWPGVAVMPVLELSSSDAVYLRAAGIPTYGMSGVFIDVDNLRAHGKDERIRVRDFYAGLEFYDRLVRALAGAGGRRPGGGARHEEVFGGVRAR